ncbi:polysaccharide deacetylase family protein [Novilysobacter antarcticus]|uniref:polysaccharide deacetylase family protein n=1 Tax=Novilysobacter antarcticus TaxID=2862543 RepID=UPI001C9A1A8C|nr:polysaccharide deacetylase family protein [Lysobacter antarcticus]
MGKKTKTARLLAAPGLRRVLSTALPWEGVLILNYHRVGDGSRSIHDRDLWSASSEAFDAQLAFLKTHSDVIGLDDIESALSRRGSRHVAITFDDGYLDNYELAYPLLRKHRLPAAFFIATGFIDEPCLPWWDEIAMLVRTTTVGQLDLPEWIPGPLLLRPGERAGVIRALLSAYKAAPGEEAARLLDSLREQARCGSNVAPVAKHWMDWKMIRDMAANGMTIGGHTVHHPVLSRRSLAQQRAEISGCAARLRAELGQTMDYFAYPVGSPDAFDERTRQCLQDAGVRLAFSYYGGIATRNSPRYDIPRVAVAARMENHLFRAMAALPQFFCRRSDGLAESVEPSL